MIENNVFTVKNTSQNRKKKHKIKGNMIEKKK